MRYDNKNSRLYSLEGHVNLKQKIEGREAQVGILGLGYVGLLRQL